MHDEAKVTSDDGDKVSHGFSLLDVVIHSCCTYIQSLSASDWVQVIVYSKSARVLAPWTACTDAGKASLDALVRTAKVETSTNLRDGIKLGMEAFENLPEEVAAAPREYAMTLAISTDGQPTEQFHPPGPSKSRYKQWIDGLKSSIEERLGPAACPTVTAIGFGNNLDSSLLSSFSDVFLHMPDPGSVGPFTVNLAAASRATAKIVHCGGGPMVANRARLIIEPASAIVSVPGYEAVPWRSGSAVAVDIGSICFDQPRHVIIEQATAAGADGLSLSLEISGVEIARASGASGSAGAAGARVEPVSLCGLDPEFDAQMERTAVVRAMQLDALLPLHAKEAPMRKLSELLSEGQLKESMETEVLLAITDGKYETWGKHYLTTLPGALLLERRTNFRDMCLQGFNKDARGQPAIHEEISSDAELVFAKLTPPAPSRNRYNQASSAGGGAPAPRSYAAMPDEFMRGGGCFGPESRVMVIQSDGSARPTRVDQVKSGDVLIGEGGEAAAIRCVVMTECVGGRAQLTRLPNGLEITEWHPIREASTGRWRFPHMVGAQVVKKTPYVYNFVLAPGHPTILVEGVPCAALGHGIADTPVVSHPYWGTDAVINDLMGKPGWDMGRVVLTSTAGPM